MNILITGVAGFIGSNFVERYLKNHPKDTIIGIDALTYAGNKENIVKFYSDRFIFIKGDINNIELIEYIFEKYEIKGIINFAAESHVDNSIKDPLIFFKTNILGVANLLDIAKNYWFNNGKFDDTIFLQVSTDEVYGSLGETGMFTEKTPLDPHSPYSSSKASADLIVKSFYDTFGMPIVITRCSNNYGPKQLDEKLIPLIISRAMKLEQLPIYGDGLQIRDWLHVNDHCDAIDLVFHKGIRGEVYNIGGNNEVKNIELVKIIIEKLSNKLNNPKINESLISYVKDRLGHDRRYAIDNTKIMNKLGWTPKINLEEGISTTLDWYINKNQLFI